jgi:hypothetical protein
MSFPSALRATYLNWGMRGEAIPEKHEGKP